MTQEQIEYIVLRWIEKEAKRGNYVDAENGLDSVCIDGWVDLSTLVEMLVDAFIE